MNHNYIATAGYTVLELVEEKYQGKLMIPDMAKKHPNTAKVLSTTKPDLSEGDIVVFARLSGDFIERDGKTILFCSNDKIFCKIKSQ